jgi:DNA replication protein DnaC
MNRGQAKSTTPAPPRAASFDVLAIEKAKHRSDKAAAADAERDAAEQSREPRRRFEKLMDEVGIRYRRCTLDSFVASTAEQKKVFTAVRDYRDTMPDRLKAGQGLVLFGPSGTGKDHLMVSLLRDLVVTHWETAKWLNGVGLYSMFRDSMDTGMPEAAIVSKLAAPTVLVLSDPQPPIGSLTPFQAQCLFQVVDERYRRGKATWVTMNAASGADAEAKIGVATVDRFRDGALTLFCNWPSYRKAIS